MGERTGKRTRKLVQNKRRSMEKRRECSIADAGKRTGKRTRKLEKLRKTRRKKGVG